MKYCQGPKCHEYRTKDRIRGPKGAKTYQTRRRSEFYYLQGNACSLNCANDWFKKFGNQAVDYFGRVTEPKKIECDNAWYKDMVYLSYRDLPNEYYFKNDLLGQRIPITQEQYNDNDLVRP